MSPRRPGTSIVPPPAALFLAAVLFLLLPFPPRPHRGGGASAASDRGGDDVDGAFVVGGYLPDYRSYIDVDAAAVHLTDLMLFSVTPSSVMNGAAGDGDGEGKGGCCLSSDHYDQIRKARSLKGERQPPGKIRLLVTVGGAGRSDGFQDVVTGSTDVQFRFLKRLVKLCREEELDGIDLDFEGIPSHGTYRAYLKFLLRASGYLRSQSLLLTVALHPGQPLPSEVCRSVDRVHVMAYDMVSRVPPASAAAASGSGGGGGKPEEERGGHHASLPSVRDAMTRFEKGGCPPSKLVVGVPAYGRHGRNPGLVKTYAEAVDEMVEAGYHATSVRGMRTWRGYAFDAPDDVAAKVEHAKRHGYGGVFFWEIGQDKPVAGVAEGGMLLEAAAEAASPGGCMADPGRPSEKEEL